VARPTCDTQAVQPSVPAADLLQHNVVPNEMNIPRAGANSLPVNSTGGFVPRQQEQENHHSVDPVHDSHYEMQQQQLESQTDAACKVQTDLDHVALHDYVVPAVLAKYGKNNKPLTDSDKASVLRFLGAKTQPAVEDFLETLEAQECYMCAEIVFVHPLSRECAHMTLSDSAGNRQAIPMKEIGQVVGCRDFAVPCDKCDSMVLALGESYYPHDSRVCPLQDRQFASVMSLISLEFKPPDVTQPIVTPIPVVAPALAPRVLAAPGSIRPPPVKTTRDRQPSSGWEPQATGGWTTNDRQGQQGSGWNNNNGDRGRGGRDREKGNGWSGKGNNM
jgi:hypothetical protein